LPRIDRGNDREPPICATAKDLEMPTRGGAELLNLRLAALGKYVIKPMCSNAQVVKLGGITFQQP
jgi:hypothetical protein